MQVPFWNLNILGMRSNSRNNAKGSAAAFPLSSLQNQTGWVKRSENNMNDIIGISIAYWHVHLS